MERQQLAGPAEAHHQATPGQESKEDTMDGKPGCGGAGGPGDRPGGGGGSPGNTFCK